MASEDDTAYKQLFAHPEMVRDLLLGLLEFQSRSDHWMALRMQVYIGLLYQDLIKRHELPAPGKLPPVFPLVLYSGERPWRATKSWADLIVPIHIDLRPLQASQRYLLIDQSRLASSDIAVVGNFAAAVFRLDRLRTESDISEELDAWAESPVFASSPSILPSLTRCSVRRLQRISRERNIRLHSIAMEVHAMPLPIIKCFEDAWRYERCVI